MEGGRREGGRKELDGIPACMTDLVAPKENLAPFNLASQLVCGDSSPRVQLT
jgi:hypothetical protein